MARRLRHDRPGAEFHVMNRGIARRTIFDTPADNRFFHGEHAAHIVSAYCDLLKDS